MVDNTTPQAETDFFKRLKRQSWTHSIRVRSSQEKRLSQLGYWSTCKVSNQHLYFKVTSSFLRWLRQACSKKGINRLIQTSKSQQSPSCSLLCQRPDPTPQPGGPAPKLMQSHPAITYRVLTLPTNRKPIDHPRSQSKSPLEGQIQH